MAQPKMGGNPAVKWMFTVLLLLVAVYLYLRK
jgi:hypothetical protein